MLDAAKLGTLYDARYAKEPFVRRPKRRLPEVVAVAGSNYVEAAFVVGPADQPLLAMS